MNATELVERLRACLLALERSPEGPRLDAEWLRARCDDTLGLSGQRRQDSLLQLQKDIAVFVEEFPDALPPLLLEQLGRIRV